MGFYTGRTGSLVYNSKPVAKIRDWSLDTTVELLSTNTIDSVSNTFTPGVKGATGSATLMYYRLETGQSTSYTEFTALLSKIHKTGAITESDRVLLTLNVGGGTNDEISFYAYITSASVSVATGELSVVPIQFTVDGDFISGGTIV
ncbi:hypothetical protein EBT31_01005 [bacterium]|jgi:hypothetical protein|nr:hypothetical protein [bacterium]